MAGVKGRSGGARPGAGTAGGAKPGAGKKRTATKWSDAFKDDLVRAIEAKKKATGKTVHEVMLDLLYNEETEARSKTPIYKALCDALIQKSTHKELEITETKYGPIILPARIDPAGVHSLEYADEEAKH